MNYYVYILANKSNRVLYIGVTNNLKRRVSEHKSKLNKGFSYRYNVDRLVYYECFKDVREAIKREKRMKKWNRAWKDELITGFNPEWLDLFNTLD
ncbi:MAG TPA: GIY-YIG nuclease family protein [Bacteroidales bacterium]|mgnify:CR=1 FL=1|nr:GIY-YIG nuclease family protein [Bacteroidales bacterium]HPE56736.1 GIY-YIG nuclease family protein [Bacteroidales bacterium]HRX96677.1 GIY-YIG nuclease family protein [Bacteroidales bacterium]